MENHTDSDQTTNRRTLLKTVASGALATTLFAGAASADDVTPEYCERMVTQYRCEETNCDCCSCDCECQSERQQRSCCEDPYGDIVRCGPWQSTGDCCTSC